MILFSSRNPHGSGQGLSQALEVSEPETWVPAPLVTHHTSPGGGARESRTAAAGASSTSAPGNTFYGKAVSTSNIRAKCKRFKWFARGSQKMEMSDSNSLWRLKRRVFVGLTCLSRTFGRLGKMSSLLLDLDPAFFTLWPVEYGL